MNAEIPQRRTLYPDIEPSRTSFLRVSDLHEIYCKQRRFFDPSAYRIVLFDQRG